MYKSNTERVPYVVNVILSWIMKSEIFFLRRMIIPAGASIICVAVKGDELNLPQFNGHPEKDYHGP